ncbi:MAG: hypothetical protein ACOCX1_01870 [Fimbriimonadaceae bacterium]
MRNGALLSLGFLLAACAPVDPGTSTAASASAAPSAPSEQEREIFYIGHSLMSDVPDMVEALVETEGAEVEWQEQFILGAPLRWQWDQPSRGDDQFESTYQTLYTDGITAETTDLIVTDSVPRGSEAEVQESIEYLGKFAEFAREKNPDVRIWYYETWHCIKSGTPKGCDYDTQSPTRHLPWRERIEKDAEMWRTIASDAAPEIRIIPVGQALGDLVDAAEAGEVPGFSTVEGFFDDDIHVNPYGKLFVAYVYVAAVFGIDPVGLPYDITDRWGRSYWDTPNWQNKQWPEPDLAAVRKMQEVAREAVSEHLGQSD